MNESQIVFMLSGVPDRQHGCLVETHCNTLHHAATRCTITRCNTMHHAATCCNTLQHNATHCNTLKHTATHCNTLQRTATRCNTLQHTATHCNNAPYQIGDTADSSKDCRIPACVAMFQCEKHSSRESLRNLYSNILASKCK